MYRTVQMLKIQHSITTMVSKKKNNIKIKIKNKKEIEVKEKEKQKTLPFSNKNRVILREEKRLKIYYSE